MDKDLKYRTAKAGVRVNVRLPPYIFFRLREIADKHKVSLSVVIRAFLTKNINDIIDDLGYEKEQSLWGRP